MLSNEKEENNSENFYEIYEATEEILWCDTCKQRIDLEAESKRGVQCKIGDPCPWCGFGELEKMKDK